MSAYYNEIDPFCGDWLGRLVGHGAIASGSVDTRSICDVREVPDVPQAHFFAGVGLWSLALRWAGVPDDFPVWTGSCPCQPFSNAGNQLGEADERHLWPEWRRLIAQHRPPVIFGEQVASAAGRDWLAAVRADLEALGYAVGAADLCAAGIGAPHIRQRLYWFAHAQRNEQPWEEPRRWEARRVGGLIQPVSWDTPWEVALARFRDVGDGDARCVAGTDAARNAIVPQVAAAFVTAALQAMSCPRP